jgi:hypothetical protein
LTEEVIGEIEYFKYENAVFLAGRYDEVFNASILTTYFPLSEEFGAKEER